MSNQFKVKTVCDNKSPCHSQLIEVFLKDKYNVTSSGHCSFCNQDLFEILNQLEESTPKLSIVK